MAKSTDFLFPLRVEENKALRYEAKIRSEAHRLTSELKLELKAKSLDSKTNGLLPLLFHSRETRPQ